MKTKINLLISLLCLAILIPTIVQTSSEEKEIPMLDNPMSVQYLRKSIPRLVLNSTIERNLKKKLKTDPLVQSYYKYLEEEAAQILKEPLLTRKSTGRSQSYAPHAMLRRMGVLCMVYRIGKNPDYHQSAYFGELSFE